MVGFGKSKQMTAVGFEPTPLRTGAWSQRLRPLGQTVLTELDVGIIDEMCKKETRAEFAAATSGAWWLLLIYLR